MPLILRRQLFFNFFGVGAHRPELHHLKRLAFNTHTLLEEEHGASIALHHERHNSEQRGKQQQPQTRADHINTAFCEG